MKISDQEYKNFTELIFDEIGITFNENKKALMESRFYKRIHHQQSIGGLFKQLSEQIIEATLAVKLWQILIDLLIELGELQGIDISVLFVDVLRNEKVVAKIQRLPEIFNGAQCA